ncbi:thioredoxin family protein [Candidatus Korobacter versatilis]|nr:thioredoxin family protein [Candidatus Koribacter versatilis]
MRKSLFVAAIFCLFACVALGEKPPSADKMMSEAKARAKAENKSIFLVFGASWCPDCDVLETFLKTPDAKALFDRYFVVVHFDVFEEAGEKPGVNTPGGENWILKFGGVSAAGEVGLPFEVVLNADGKPIVDSHLRTKGKTVGFPETPEEIAWFIKMLRSGAPAMTSDESSQIEDLLKRQS